jgi:hypothetical protein
MARSRTSNASAPFATAAKPRAPSRPAVFRPGARDAADPAHVAATTPRAEVDALLAELLSFELNPKTRDVFTAWDREFLADMRRLVTAQDEIMPAHPRPLSGRQLVVVFTLVQKVGALTVTALRGMKDGSQ